MYDLSALLRGNAYPGRGVLLGRSEDGKSAVIAYFIMGRSENSRNRIFVETEDGIRTQAYDPAKMTDPSLIIYHPVRMVGTTTIVTNGDQTDTVARFMAEGKSSRDALFTREFEPDAPNFTPRISGVLSFGQEDGFKYEMSILKSADEAGSACSRFFYDYPALAGKGHLIHTYERDGNPLPTFCGEPRSVAIDDDIDAMTEAIWESLDADNKISLYVAYTDLNSMKTETRMINKNERKVR